MDRYCDEPTLADMLSDSVTLAVMDADGVDPGDLAATLTQTAEKRATSPGSIDQNNRSIGSTIAKDFSLIEDRTPQSNFRKA